MIDWVRFNVPPTHGRKGRDGQKKKIGKANERKGKVKGGKDEEVNGQKGRGVPRPHTGPCELWSPVRVPQHWQSLTSLTGNVQPLHHSSATLQHHDCYVSSESVTCISAHAATVSHHASTVVSHTHILPLIAADHMIGNWLQMDHQMSRKLQSRVKAAIWSWWSTDRSWTSSVSLLFTAAHHQYTHHFTHCVPFTADK